MKKKLIVLLLLLALFVSGCEVNTKDNDQDDDNKSSQKESKNGLSKDNELGLKTDIKNYKITSTVNMTMSVSGQEMTTKTTSNGSVDQENGIEYLVTEANVYGFKVTTKSYVDFKNNLTYTSTDLTTGWTKTTGSAESFKIEEMLDKFSDLDALTKIDDKTYEIKLSSSDIKGLIDDSEDLDDFKGDMKATVSIDDGYITKIVYDLNNIHESISKFNMVITLSDYNEAGPLEIPSEVTE